MPKCPECGALYGTCDDFCPQCGKKLTEGKKESKKVEKIQKQKNPWLACFLNLLILGAGFWYLGKWGKGFLFLLAGITATVAFKAPVGVVIVLVTAMVYSYKDAKNLNQERK